MNYKESIGNFLRSINGNVQLIKKTLEVNKVSTDKQWILPEWSKALQAFYQILDGFELHWVPFAFQDRSYVRGMVNLLKGEAIASDWKETVYYEETGFHRLQYFRIIDFFVSEAAVGFYDLPGEREELYLYHFEAEPLPLNVNFEGYIQLLINARGYFYWQKSLLAIESGKSNQEHEDLKEYLPQIFPEFSYSDFETLYQQVKLR